MDNSKKSLITLDGVAYGIIAVIVFLIPFFFLPFLNISLDAGKAHLLEAGVVVAFFIGAYRAIARWGSSSSEKHRASPRWRLFAFSALVTPHIFRTNSRVSFLVPVRN